MTEAVPAYRITKRKWAANAFDGEAAKRYPGRWNLRGHPLIYTAASRSLAMLEILVHYEEYELLTDHFICIPLTIPSECILELDEPLPDDWRTDPPPPSTRTLGTGWLESMASLALRVPSTVIPAEANYLINPLHPDIHRLEIGDAEPLDIDPRLLTQT